MAVTSSHMDYPPEIEALVYTVRRFIRENLPEVEERIYKDGLSSGYHTPECGAFCGLFPRKNAVYLSFSYGHLLPDETGLLGSEGRHVALRPGEALPEEALFKLLVAALIIEADRHR